MVREPAGANGRHLPQSRTENMYTHVFCDMSTDWRHVSGTQESTSVDFQPTNNKKKSYKAVYFRLFCPHAGVTGYFVFRISFILL